MEYITVGTSVEVKGCMEEMVFEGNPNDLQNNNTYHNIEEIENDESGRTLWMKENLSGLNVHTYRDDIEKEQNKQSFHSLLLRLSISANDSTTPELRVRLCIMQKPSHITDSVLEG